MGYRKREVALVVVVMAAMMVGAEAAITCGTVNGKLLPCVAYAQARAPAPSKDCCSGVTSLYAVTKNSRPDRVASCNCIKTLAGAFGSTLKQANVNALPGKCGVNLGYNISPSTDCTRIP